MKAAVRHTYGLSDVISIEDVNKPIPNSNEILIKVHAATISRTDCFILQGKPPILKLFLGLFKPRSLITGADFAGQVASIGNNVTLFKVGDKIMGFGGAIGWGGNRGGSHAQYIVLPENKPITLIPGNLDYIQAAACLEGAYYAYNGINSLKFTPGQKAMVNGGTGAIGSSIIQLLKLHHVQVTAVCRQTHFELVKSLGADRVIDYETTDFTKDSEKYDFVFDAVGKSSFKKCKPLLKNKGYFLPADGFLNFILAITTSILGGKRVLFPPPKNIQAGLNYIKELCINNTFKPVIDRKYSFKNIKEGFDYVFSGQKIGNVILEMDANT
jgi:NADPH:quinone reductase-like Zn-dependent oxidoreductase